MNIPKQFITVVFGLILLSNCFLSHSQEISNVAGQPIKIFVVTKNDGTEYVGQIISLDDREVLLETKEIGRLYIPKHEIKSIQELTASDIKSGALPGNNIFSSRYFLTTNGLRMRKGDSYALINYWGPEIQYSVSNGLTLGAMTTWVAMPIVLSAKTTFSTNEKIHFGLGLLAGTLSWAKWSSVGALPYATVTLGNSKNNFSFSGGYAMLSSEDFSGNAPLISFGCLFRITDKISLVGDSFFYLKEGSFSIIVPGIRVSKKPTRAFQIGFAAISADGETTPVPIPVISWFIRL